jgi:hypothetical protein
MYRFGYYYNTFKVRIINYTSNTFADPRRETAAAIVADVDAVTGYILFPSLDYDAFLQQIIGEEVVTVNEADGYANVTVSRKGGMQGNLDVLYKTEDGTAIAGKHYENTWGNLTWLEGDTDDKIIKVKFIDSPSFNPRSPSKNFSVVLYNFTMFVPDVLTTPTYLGPNPVRAVVSIIDPHGPGVLELEKQEIIVDEGAGTARVAVVRRGGSRGIVRVDYTTSPGTAEPSSVTPTIIASCAEKSDGHYWMESAGGGSIRKVLCTGGEASLFIWRTQDTKQPSLWDRKCAAFDNAGGHDAVILWSDLNARVGTAANDDTSASAYWTWSRGQTFGGSTQALPDVPIDQNNRARPVPFPFHGVVVWFVWDAAVKQIKWKDTAGQSKTAGFSVMTALFVDEADLLAAMEDPATYNLYFISNGISSLHVGYRHKV